MHKDELKGKIKQGEGKMQEDLGDLMDDPDMESKGLSKQAEGKMQEGVGKVKDSLHKAID